MVEPVRTGPERSSGLLRWTAAQSVSKRAVCHICAMKTFSRTTDLLRYVSGLFILEWEGEGERGGALSVSLFKKRRQAGNFASFAAAAVAVQPLRSGHPVSVTCVAPPEDLNCFHMEPRTAGRECF